MRIRFLLPLFVSSFILLRSAFPQGSLTPPGPPAPTVKTLDQGEARIPIDATHTPGNTLAEFAISAPGSYYLTGNLIISKPTAVDITAAEVTVDWIGLGFGGGRGARG